MPTLSITLIYQEQKIKEGLYMMGLKDEMFYISWFLTYAFQVVAFLYFDKVTFLRGIIYLEGLTGFSYFINLAVCSLFWNYHTLHYGNPL